ncbi:hypothetical protein AB0M61_14560 [Streptomyces sp. NPDC051642]
MVTDPALTRRVLVTAAVDFTKGRKIIDALRVFFGDGLGTSCSPTCPCWR